MNSLWSSYAIFPDLDEAGLRQGLHDLQAGKIERFVHVCVAEGPSGPRQKLLEISRLQVHGCVHFVAMPEGLTDTSAATTTLRRALAEAVAPRRAVRRGSVTAASAQEEYGVHLSTIDLGGRTHLLALLDDAAGPPSADRLLLAQEEERHQIAIELHDSTSQHLAAMNLGLTRLRRLMQASRAERQVVDDVSRSLQDAIREIRAFSYLMNPPQLERDGLEATTRRFAAGFEERTGIRTNLTVAGAPDASSLAVQHTLFRVLQEALTNIHRKARATDVRLALIRRADWITLRVHDDAPVMGERCKRVLRVPVGVGVAGMHAPVVELGGSLRVLHGEDGAQIIARLPTGLRRRRGLAVRRKPPRR